MKLKLRDITQAYTQATTLVNRYVIVEAPEEMGVGKEYVLVVVRPLYGLAEAALHWYMPYAKFHIEDLGMQKNVGRYVFVRQTVRKCRRRWR